MKRCLFVLIFLLGYLGAETLVLGLESAKEIALKNNPSIKIAEKSVKSAQAKIIESRGGLMPTIDAFSSLEHSWDLQKSKIPNFLKPTLAPNNLAIGNSLKILGNEMNNQDLIAHGNGLIQSAELMPDYMEMAFGLENTLVAGVKLEQPIFVGGALWKSYQISKIIRNIAYKQLEVAIQNLLDNVTQAYYFTLYAKSAKVVSKEALVSAEENLTQVKKFYDSGKASRLDLLRAEVQLENLRPALISAENRLTLAYSRLNIIMGFKESESIIVSDKMEYKESPLQKMKLEELVDLAKRSRPEIDILKYQQQISNKQLMVARGAYLPAVTLGSTYQYIGMRNNLDFVEDDFNKSFSTSLSISLPLFTGFKRNAKIQQVKIQRNELEDRMNSTVDGIKLEVEEAYFSMSEAEKKVQTQKKAIEQAKEALRLATLMYKEGGATQLDVLNSNLSLNTARMNYQESLFEFNTAISKLSKAISKL